jgi:hypothetical protein
MKLIAPTSVTDSTLVSSNVPENDYPVYSATTTYALDAFVIYIAPNVHRVYQSLAAANLGNVVTDTTKWLDCGPTNRWKMHDQTLQSQTVSPSIVNVYSVEGLCTAVAALNLDASSMHVRMTDEVDGVVFDSTISLISPSGIDSWYKYFFEPITQSPDAIMLDLPPYANPTIEVSIFSTKGSVACGALLLGNEKDIGDTQFGAKIGITDYSTKTQDAFGNYSITKRPYRKTGDFPVIVDTHYVDQLQILLAQYRSTPVLYVGSESFASSFVYGFYRDFDITIQYPSYALCSINIEGLT